jgi:hypothetical protein
MKKHDPLHIKTTLAICVVVSVASGIGLSLVTKDPHWLNRAGALIAGIAAVAILFQIRAEIEMEEERGELEEKAQRARDSEPASPLDKMEMQLTLKRVEVQRHALVTRRLRIASYVISTALFGELLHGFGDLVMCYAFHVCRGH